MLSYSCTIRKCITKINLQRTKKQWRLLLFVEILNRQHEGTKVCRTPLQQGASMTFIRSITPGSTSSNSSFSQRVVHKPSIMSQLSIACRATYYRLKILMNNRSKYLLVQIRKVLNRHFRTENSLLLLRIVELGTHYKNSSKIVFAKKHRVNSRLMRPFYSSLNHLLEIFWPTIAWICLTIVKHSKAITQTYRHQALSISTV